MRIDFRSGRVVVRCCEEVKNSRVEKIFEKGDDQRISVLSRVK